MLEYLSSSQSGVTSRGVEGSLTLASDGVVWVKGDNECGELGLPIQNCPEPTIVPTPRRVIKIAIGSLHTLVLTSNGQVYSSGFNRHGQLGLGDFVDRTQFSLVPLRVKIVDIYCHIHTSYLTTSSQRTYVCGDNSMHRLGIGNLFQYCHIPTRLPIIGRIKITRVYPMTVYATDDGRVYHCGQETNGLPVLQA